MSGKYNIGEIIQDRYLVRSILSGGMGLIYICYDQQGKDIVAVKTIQDRLRLSLANVDRFITEAKVWLSLGIHPHIVKVHKVEVIDGQIYIFMEYIAGHPQYGSSLRSWILRKAITINTSLDIAVQICNGLAYSQDIVPGIVHRDLKPENILMTEFGVAKVTDFGLAKAASENHKSELIVPPDEIQEIFHTKLTRIGYAVGTPPYMSPEQCQGTVLDSRSDVYSIGCILFEMLTGRWLLENEDPKEWIKWHLYVEPIAPSQVNNKIPKFLDKIVLRCLEKKSERRYNSVKELANDISEAYYRISGKHWQAITDSHAHGQEWTVVRANSYFNLGMTDQALVEIEGVLREKPQNLEALLVKSRILGAAGKPEEMLILCECILALDSFSAKAYNNKGICLLQLNRLNEAHVAFRTATDLDPSLAAAWHNLGKYYESIGDEERSLQCVEQALKLNHWNSVSWLLKAQLLNKKGIDKKGKNVEMSLCLEQALIYSNTDMERANLALSLTLEVPRLFRDDEHLYRLAVHAMQNVDIELTSQSLAPMRAGTPLVTNEVKAIVNAYPVLNAALGKAVVVLITNQFTLRVTGSLNKAVENSDLMLTSLQQEIKNYSLDSTIVDRFFSYLTIIRLFMFAETLLIDLNRREEAIKLLLDSVERTSDVFYRHYAWMVCGQTLFEMGNWDDALTYLRQAAQFDNVNYPNSDRFNPNNRGVPELIAACELALDSIDKRH